MSRELGTNEWWAVVESDGGVVLDSLNIRRSDAIRAYMDEFFSAYNMTFWRTLRERGHVRCVRVEIREVK